MTSTRAEETEMTDTRVMHRLVFATVLVALAQGCIIVDDIEEGSQCVEDRADGACFEITASCPEEAVTYTVITQATDGSGSFMDPFPCGQPAAITLDPGTYDIRVEATTAEEDVLFGSEVVPNQEVADLDTVPLHFEFPDGKGFFWLDWTIEDGGGGPLTCEDVGATQLEVESVPTSAGSSETHVLPCVYGSWQTGALDLGSYDVTVTLVGDGGALGSSEPISGELVSNAVIEELPAVTFSIIATAR